MTTELRCHVGIGPPVEEGARIRVLPILGDVQALLGEFDDDLIVSVSEFALRVVLLHGQRFLSREVGVFLPVVHAIDLVQRDDERRLARSKHVQRLNCLRF